jgi:predicted enzyme related to lactoylglutathione lyase
MSETPLNTVTWWELPVTDVARAEDFYAAVFGWAFSSFGDDEAYTGVTYEGRLIGGLYRADGPPPEGPSVRTYVNVADLEATLTAVEAAGGSVRTPRTEVGGDMGWWAEISDPDGRWLGLCTDNPPRGH